MHHFAFEIDINGQSTQTSFLCGFLHVGYRLLFQKGE